MKSKPALLRSGDTVALISPASPFYRSEFSAQQVLAQVRAGLGGLGLRTVTGSHATDGYGYLAGRDEDRARDLMAAFADPEVNAIICMGGGYGTPRILELLDYDLIARNPKIFVGYSDITALHTAIGQRSGLVTFHGPMGFELARIQRTLSAAVDRSKSDFSTGEAADEAYLTEGAAIPDAATDTQPNEITSNTSSARPTDAAAAAFTWEWFLRALMHPDALGQLPAVAPWQSEPLQCIVPGIARGPLVGGNLSLLADTMGTPYEINTTDKILLIEEIGEAPYRIDRMLTQLRLAGKLQAAAGFIIAEWTDCKPTDPARPSLTLRQVLADVIEPLGKPTVYGLAAGHGPGRLTLPFGVPVTVDARNTADPNNADDLHSSHSRIIIEEPGVGH